MTKKQISLEKVISRKDFYDPRGISCFANDRNHFLCAVCVYISMNRYWTLIERTHIVCVKKVLTCHRIYGMIHSLSFNERNWPKFLLSNQLPVHRIEECWNFVCSVRLRFRFNETKARLHSVVRNEGNEGNEGTETAFRRIFASKTGL